MIPCTAAKIVCKGKVICRRFKKNVIFTFSCHTLQTCRAASPHLLRESNETSFGIATRYKGPQAIMFINIMNRDSAE